MIHNSMMHILPINDLMEHESQVWCSCKPEIKEGIVLHNSLDGREHFETDHDERTCEQCKREDV